MTTRKVHVIRNFFQSSKFKRKKNNANCAAGGQIWLMYILKEKSINPSQKNETMASGD